MLMCKTRVCALSQSAPFLTVGVTVEDNTVARVFSDNDMVLVSYVRLSRVTPNPQMIDLASCCTCHAASLAATAAD